VASLSLRALLVAAVVAPAPVAAQRTPEQMQASWEARQGDFDYLLGDWEFIAVNRTFGTFRGYWSAVRLAEGAEILDEYRVVDDSGATVYASTTVRAYNAALDRWELISAERGGGLQNVGTARRAGDEMHIEQRFGVMGPDSSLWRIRYYDIRPDRFSWTADRSTDGGATWTTAYMEIDARRIGPPRFLGPLAVPKSP